MLFLDLSWLQIPHSGRGEQAEVMTFCCKRDKVLPINNAYSKNSGGQERHRTQHQKNILMLTGGRGGTRPSMSVSRSFSPPPGASVPTDNSVDATATSGARVIHVGQSVDSELRDTLDGR